MNFLYKGHDSIIVEELYHFKHITWQLFSHIYSLIQLYVTILLVFPYFIMLKS